MKLWGTRFQKEADKRLNDFNSSIKTDSRMYSEDIEGSLAHAKMLAVQGIISKVDLEAIVSNLSNIKKDMEAGSLIIDEKCGRYTHVYRGGAYQKMRRCRKKASYCKKQE